MLKPSIDNQVVTPSAGGFDINGGRWIKADLTKLTDLMNDPKAFSAPPKAQNFS
jgi:hypothetical protein